ncbi:MAG: 6-phospho-alpha-glucosidase [Collinsella sp.]|nr:6-phospho-alpha-glucosidase [Collinsella sp.]
MKDKLNIVIVGGGSTWCPGILKALTKHMDILPLNRVMLYDIDAERQRPIGEFGKILFAEEEPGVEFGYTTDKDEAYTDVDFVLCQIRTGGYEMRSKDEKIPLHMGIIGQETVGPGGMAYGMRSMHDMVEIVNDVRAHSPEAWIINYTNPAAIVAYGLERVLPDEHRVLNICDQPVNLMRSYGRLLGRDMSKTEPVYFGLNHFGWFKHIYDEEGHDLVPQIKEYTEKNGFLPADAEQRDQSWLDTYAMVKDMLEDFPDYLPNTYLQYYLYPEYKVAHLDPDYTRSDEVINGREKRVFAECERVAKVGTAKNSSVVQNDAHGDMIVEITSAIYRNTNKTFIVIVPNNGIIEGMPDDAMVEVAASVGANGPQPYAVGKIGTFYRGLMENQYAYERLTVEAWMERSYEKALQALTLNRLVGDAKKARKVLDKLIEANKDYWPELK